MSDQLFLGFGENPLGNMKPELQWTSSSQEPRRPERYKNSSVVGTDSNW